MTPGNRTHSVWPLNAFQEGMLYLDERSRESRVPGERQPYLCQAVVTLSGGVDAERLSKAYTELIGAHDILAARFRQLSSGEAVAVIPTRRPVEWRNVDVPATDREETLAAESAGELDRGFDLRNGPCIRAVLVGRHLILTTHHIISDGWSVNLMVRDLMRLYDGRPVRGAQFSDHLLRLRGLDAAASLGHWKDVLRGVGVPTWLTSDGTSSSTVRTSVSRSVRPETHRRTAAYAAAEGVTVNSVLVASVGVAVGAYLGRTDVVLGSTVTDRGRGGRADEDIIGPMINTVPLRIIDGPDVVQQVHRSQLGAIEHSATSLSQIESSRGGSGLFDTIVVCTEQPASEAVADSRVLGVTTADTTHYPVGFEIDPRSGTITCVYDPDALGEASAELLLNSVERAVDRLTASGSAHDLSLWGLFAEAVLRNPDAMAVSDGPTRLTYTQLDRRAAGLAGRLQNTGIGRGDRVVIALPRSLDLITAILAVSRRGATAVPLTPGLPPARLKTILDTVHPKAVICPPTDHHHYTPHTRITDLTDLTTTHPGTTVPVTPHDTAYIVFTSGTSGTPKGVLIPHHGLTALRTTQHTTAPTQPGSRVLQFSTVGFDVLFWEISWSLFTGAELVIVPEEQRLGTELAQFLHDHNITHAAIPPAVITTWPTETTLPHDITLAVGTESMPPTLIHRWAPHCRLINCYGPTETTINATLWKAPPHWNNKNVPIGHPDTGKRIYLLDNNLHPTPHGTTGEIFIAGTGIATGYLNNPTLTAQHFLPDPHGNPGDRMYRTGDTGRWNNNNELEFHGRTDRQIQIRGHRVEPTEIEKHLTALNDITTATITTRETPHGTQLIAYIVTENHHPTPTWKEQLATHLPHYMLPTYIIPITHLPLTPNNKIDHTRLPPPTTTPPKPHHTPQTPLQHHITNTFADILQLPTIGIHDNFFTHGGHSLLALRLVGRIRAETGRRVPLGLVLANPTVAGVVHALEALDRDPEPAPVAEPAVADLTPDELSLYLVNRAEPSSTAYTLAFSVCLTGSVDEVAVRRAVRAVLSRHPMLRSRFRDSDGSVRMHIGGAGDELVRTVSAEPGENVLDRLAAEPFDLSREHPVRITLVRRSSRECDVVCVIHHIVFDEESLRVFCSDLAAAYRGSPLAPQPLERPPARTTSASESDFWRRALADLDPGTIFPPRYGRRTDHALAIRTLDAAHVRALEDLGRRRGTTLFVVLTAALASSVAEVTGRRRFLLGTPVSTRETEADYRSVAYRVRTGLLNCTVGARTGPAELIDAIDSARTAMVTHSSTSLADIVRLLPRQGPVGQAPFDILVGFVDERPHDLDFGPDVAASVSAGETQEAQFPLAIDFVRSGTTGALAVRAAHDTSSADRAVVAALLDGLEKTLSSWPDMESSAVGTPGERSASAVEAPAGRPRPAPEALSLWGLFSEVAARFPDAPAVSDSCGRLSYGELATQAEGLAGALRATGVGRGDRVVVSVPRSAALTTAVLAVSRCGAAVVSLPQDMPSARLDVVLAEVNAAAAICEEETAARFAPLPTVAPTTAAPGVDEAVVMSALETAYVVFTSGSTGTPKGVVVPNEGLGTLLATQRLTTPTGPGSRVLQFSSSGFDMIFWETCWSVLAGAELVFVPEDRRLGGDLVRFINEEGITHAAISPSVVSSWPSDATLPEGLTLGIGSERVPPAAVRRWTDRCRVISGYGPTETTVNATLWQARRDWRGSSTPIGVPDVGKRVHLLGPTLEPVPHGTIGEVFIAGSGLADGYLNDPVLTAQRFLPDVFGMPGERMYRTGDMACWTDEGVLEFHGRIDDQVKIRGFRIEPVEIERQLTAIDGISSAVVVARENTATGAELVAYVVAEPPGRTASWRRRLSAALPDYMIPARFVVLDTLPLNANNKVDRERLPEPGPVTAPDAHAVAERPRTDLEQRVADVFASVLGLPSIGVHDDFFAHGGHSLLALKLVARLQETIGSPVSVKALFTSRTVSGLCAALASGRPEETTDEELRRDRGLPLPPRRPAPAGDVHRPSDYLVTGGTGFFGVHLLAELLRRSDEVVHCLVRARTRGEAEQRLTKQMRAQGLWSDAYRKRLQVHPGDLAKPRADWSPEDLPGTGRRIGAVVHNGARVNHLEQYRDLRAVNVLSVPEILALTAESGAEVHFVSTLSVAELLPPSRSDELHDSPRTVSERLNSGYNQTKWVAEGLFLRAAGRGHPVLIHRPGHLGGAVENGWMPVQDSFVQFVRTCAGVGGVPSFAPPLDLLPVDTAAAQLVSTVLSGVSDRTPRNMPETHGLGMARLADLLSDEGRRVRLMHRDEWNAAVWQAARSGTGGSVSPVALAMEPGPGQQSDELAGDLAYFGRCVRNALREP
ncbi:amino acid adenylation domain-containing protein [Streptomyces anulatus]|uniref:amino acid adenylation domain-containing protein n=1 Tax=Streptomyces anulatus TaxID=1892 RepID=UPI00386C33B6|nr:amino acid adenylation domain-containing protein [Streptomyces anulatus]